VKKKHFRTQEPAMERRKFLSSLGWLGVFISGVFAALGNILYLKPAVSYGPATNFRVGRPEDFKEGIKEVFENERVAIVREKTGFAALSIVCTHLGCTIQTNDAGFNCPCHGSQFDSDGNVTGGPAPRSLDWYQVSLAPNGELEVDKTMKVVQGTYFSV
jgi:cytochrome b6-f complex iron-sulfur subunit